jgi:hypothetical protein
MGGPTYLITLVGKFLAGESTLSPVSNPILPFSGASQSDGVNATFFELPTLVA